MKESTYLPIMLSETFIIQSVLFFGGRGGGSEQRVAHKPHNGEELCFLIFSVNLNKKLPWLLDCKMGVPDVRT